MRISKSTLTALFCFSVLMTGCATIQEAGSGSSARPKAAPSVMKKVTPDKLMIADFNAGVRPNLIGGDFGAWDRDPGDPTQFCEAEFSTEVKAGMEGSSMKLTYDVDSPESAFNGFWMKLEGTDFSTYNSIVFSVKGETKDGFTDKLVIELKSPNDETGKNMVSGITAEWQEFVLPLSSFSGLSSYAQLSEFVVVFDDTNSSPKTGVIYLDNIYVKK
ncbi:MAG: carbohydrate binding domain-containing protein [Elusimicrobiota bacterium]